MVTANKFKFKENSNWVSILDMMYPVNSYILMEPGKDPTTLYGGTWATVTAHNGRWLACKTNINPAPLTDAGATRTNVSFTPTLSISAVTLTASNATYTSNIYNGNPTISSHSFSHTHTPCTSSTYSVGWYTHVQDTCSLSVQKQFTTGSTATQFVPVRTGGSGTGNQTNANKLGSKIIKTNLTHYHSLPNIAAADATQSHTHTISASATNINLEPGNYTGVTLWKRTG